MNSLKQVVIPLMLILYSVELQGQVRYSPEELAQAKTVAISYSGDWTKTELGKKYYKALDSLEQKYAGRLVGEVFNLKKEKLKKDFGIDQIEDFQKTHFVSWETILRAKANFQAEKQVLDKKRQADSVSCLNAIVRAKENLQYQQEYYESQVKLAEKLYPKKREKVKRERFLESSRKFVKEAEEQLERTKERYIKLFKEGEYNKDSCIDSTGIKLLQKVDSLRNAVLNEIDRESYE